LQLERIKMAQAEKRQFKMHPQLIMDTMQRQAGTLDKAILEGVMNGVDAGSSSINITLTDSKLIVVDDGRGFRSRKEIDDWFETFGQPHTESEGKTYGRFRMGRGQLFAYGKNLWRAGAFRMSVDINNRGLDYTLETLEQEHEGCRIEIKLYEKLLPSELNEIIDDLKFKAKFVEIPVILNEKQINKPLTEYKWTHEKEKVDLKLDRNAKELCVYNQGVHVISFPSWKYGIGGEVVSKNPLKVNFARNEIMSDCPLWKSILATIIAARDVFGDANSKREQAVRANDNTRKNMCRQIRDGNLDAIKKMRTAKIIPNASLHSGKNIPVATINEILKEYKGRITIAEDDYTGYDHDVAEMMGHKLCFVTTKEILDWFGCDNLQEVLDILNKTGMCDNGKRGGTGTGLKLVDFKKQQKSLTVDNYLVPESEWTTTEKLLMYILHRMIGWFVRSKSFPELPERRKVCIGAGNVLDNTPAWTDGFSYIAINRSEIKRMPAPTLQQANWAGFARLIMHELCHQEPTMGEHKHSNAFYKRYHDLANYNNRRDIFGKFTQNCMLELIVAYSNMKKKMPKSLWDQLDSAEKSNQVAEEIDLLEKIQEGGSLPEE